MSLKLQESRMVEHIQDVFNTHGFDCSRQRLLMNKICQEAKMIIVVDIWLNSLS